MLAVTQAPKLSREDRETLRLLDRVEAKRAELRELEDRLAESVRGFGKRRGYLFGSFREDSVRSELRREGHEV